MLTTPTKLPLPIPRHGHGFICELKEGLRAGEFARQWADLGGAVGIASFMREQSIPDLDWLCRRLGKLYKISASKAERQERFSELLILLCPLDPRKPTESPNPNTAPFERDRRPLRKLYGHLVRACTDEVSQQWYPAAGWEDRMRQYLPATHADQVNYRQQQLEKCFSGRCLDLGPVDGIIDKDKRFAMDLLARVANQDPKNFDLEPARFLDSLALPLAKHWWRRGRDTRNTSGCGLCSWTVSTNGRNSERSAMFSRLMTWKITRSTVTSIAGGGSCGTLGYFGILEPRKSNTHGPKPSSRGCGRHS